jgi:hypothetical protein
LDLRGKGEITGGWRKLDNKELRNLYLSPIGDQIKESERGGMRILCRFSLGNLKDIENL